MRARMGVNVGVNLMKTRPSTGGPISKHGSLNPELGGLSLCVVAVAVA